MQIASFYASAGLPQPGPLQFAAMTQMAMVDWSAVPDDKIAAVCAGARQRAAKRSAAAGRSYAATLADVLAAWHDLRDRERKANAAAEKHAHAERVRSGAILPEPTFAESSDEGRAAFMRTLYQAAKAPIPAHLAESKESR